MVSDNCNIAIVKIMPHFLNRQFLIILLAAVTSITILNVTYRLSNTNVANSVAERAFSHKSEVEVPSMVLANYKTTAAFEQYKPKYVATTIHPSNYGDRHKVDVYGNPVKHPPIVVLHETTGSLMSAIHTFKTPHPNENNQVSYHAIIALDGTIIYLVPAEKRAFGAGNSAFRSSSGLETVKTNPDLPSSVNNFAYHISLETPPDGRGNGNRQNHSGYTDSQYKSLAWLLALSNIPDERITTHKAVDRSGNRSDPRSFDFDRLFQILHTYRQQA